MTKNNVVTLPRCISRTLLRSSNCYKRCGGSLTLIGRSTSGALLLLNFVIPMVLNDKIESFPLSSPALIIGGIIFGAFLGVWACNLSVDHEDTEKLVVYVGVQAIKIALMALTIFCVVKTMNPDMKLKRTTIHWDRTHAWGIELKEMFYDGDKTVLALASLYLTVNAIDVITWIFVFIYLMKSKVCVCTNK